MTVQEFKQAIKDGKCPFCATLLKYYDGALGYEAMVCKECNLSVDVNGIHIEGVV